MKVLFKHFMAVIIFISLIIFQGWPTAVIKIPRYDSRYFGSTEVLYHGNLQILYPYRYRMN